ncbi:MAG: RimK family protein [Acidobacteria bacterium]|nr:RimK family protein [Acidobacteriota bacterium]
MSILFVVERAEDWPLEVPGVEVVPARRYLTDPAYSTGRGVKVFNLCRRYRYQSVGYYVSLLATARDHRPLPSVSTLQDLQHRALLRLVSEDVEDEIERSLASITSDEFVLSIYFGRNMAKRHLSLALSLFNLFPAPLLRAQFFRGEEGWEMRSLRPIAARDIPPAHKDFVVEAARAYFTRPHRRSPRVTGRYDLAILANPEEKEPPSNDRALKRFVKAAEKVGFDVEIIAPEDIGRLAEFDALFIRETTSVPHHTYRFSRRAEAEGLVVIDDPASIVRCTNKVFLAEALTRAKVPIPKTWIVDRDSLVALAGEVTFPCILKQPDSSFSQGVVRVESQESFLTTCREFLEDSELLIAQEFLPTDYDWRIGLLEGKPLYAARYRMARAHWQIIKRDAEGKAQRYGGVEAVPLDQVPPYVLDAACRSGKVIGDGLYGVDLKERNGSCFVIEVNDNPSIDAGYEDAEIGEELYQRIMAVLMERVERRKERRETT